MNREVDPAQLPSLQQLHRASAAAVLIGSILVVTTVLPAEWGIDPTGLGSVVGLTAMGELKAGAAADIGATRAPEFIQRTDTITVTLQPNRGTEVKAVLRAGDALEYTWSAAGTPVFYDFHGEPKGAAPDVFTSFEKGTRAEAQGTFEAPFEGVHGWYWKNRSAAPVTLTLETSGVYHSLAER